MRTSRMDSMTFMAFCPSVVPPVTPSHSSLFRTIVTP